MTGKRALVIGLVVFVAGIALFVWTSRTPRPARTISDRAFAAAATDACSGVIPRLRARPDQNRSEGRNEEATAARVDKAVAGLSDLVDELDALEVRPADRPEVERWLEAWRDYIAAGRRYAAAVRSDDADEFSAEAEASRTSLNAIGRFARANRIDACIP